MKPKWEDAPDWANWLAMNEDGRWWWYENKPSRLSHTWNIDVEAPGNARAVESFSDNWGKSLEPRPGSDDG